MQADTIAAIATPWGSGGIGIIKISGLKARSIVAALFRTGKYPGPPAKINGAKKANLNFRNIHYGHIIDPGDQKVVDEVMLSVMPAPHTYTREDVVEINAHAGVAVMRQIMMLVLAHGARLATPGEFTIRAFMNGRVDLIRAEAVIDIINARTTGALNVARRHLLGDMTVAVQALRKQLIDLLTNIEADIEFGGDSETVYLDANRAEETLTAVSEKIQRLLEKHEQFSIVRDGLKLVIVGKPNVGKSSLLNAFINDERALVTEFPGTTRDLIRENLNIAGVPVVLTDTAGLHESEDPIEKMGIRKTWQDLEIADMVLFVVDGSRNLEPVDQRIFRKISPKPCLIVQNKADLPENDDFKKLPQQWYGQDRIKISALNRQGFEELQIAITQKIIAQWVPDNEDEIVPNLRQTQNLKRCFDAIQQASQNLKSEYSMDLCAIDLRDAVGALEESLGIKTGQDVIENIFNRFCIGK